MVADIGALIVENGWMKDCVWLYGWNGIIDGMGVRLGVPCETPPAEPLAGLKDCDASGVGSNCILAGPPVGDW
jgi:hypothetical protein